MKNLFLFLLLCLLTAGARAQEDFTNHLQDQDGQGKVTLHHDSEINDLVNGNATLPGTKPSKDDKDSLTNTTPLTGAQRVHTSGYRIQVYAGGNTRQAKIEAQAMERRVKGYFGSMSVYTHFMKPRWVCRCGDFKTREEANDVLRQMRATGKFPDATIVRSKIFAR